MDFLALFIVYVGVLVLIDWFLRRYTSLRLLRFKFRPGFMKLLVGSVAFLLGLPAMGRVVVAGMGSTEPEPLDFVLSVVLLILSANLILLGLIDVIGAAIELIDAAVKKRQA